MVCTGMDSPWICESSVFPSFISVVVLWRCYLCDEMSVMISKTSSMFVEREGKKRSLLLCDVYAKTK